MTSYVTRRGFNISAGSFALGAVLEPSISQAASGKVVVGTWGGDYQNLLQQNIVDPLAKPAGLDVIMDTATEPVRKNKLLTERRLPRGSVDVAAFTSPAAYEMWKNGALETLDESNIPNLKHVLPILKTPYSIPHIYTGRVILYNPKLVTTKPTSYADLWRPEYAGKVGVIDILYQTTIESAALINGGGLSNNEPGKEKLLELKKLGVKVYPTNEAMAQALKTEECAICIMWLARGVMWKKAGIPVEVAYPKEAVVLYISEITVPKNAANKEGAFAFLNDVLSPQPQIAFAKTMGYSPTIDNSGLDPTLAAAVALPPEVQKNVMKQDQEYLAKNDAQLLEWWTKVFKS